MSVCDADCFALCVKHCLFGIWIGKRIKPYLQVFSGPSLPFSAFCQWDEKQSQWMYRYMVCSFLPAVKQAVEKTTQKGSFVFTSHFVFTRTRTGPLYFPQKKKKRVFHVCDSLTYFCTVPLFKLLWKKVVSSRDVCSVKVCVILLWTKSIKTWIIYHQNMTIKCIYYKMELVCAQPQLWLWGSSPAFLKGPFFFWKWKLSPTDIVLEFCCGN